MAGGQQECSVIMYGEFSMMKILFITSVNLASNPRLVKEVRLAVKSGFSVTVIQFRMGNWTDELTDELMQQFSSVRFIGLSAMRKPFLPWFLSSVMNKIFSLLPLDMLPSTLLSVAIGKRSLLLLQRLQTIQEKFDWVIAHNPAAFYPAKWFAKKRNAKLGIDVEDYHPGETTNPKLSTMMKKLMQQTLPAASYCSYAAPLIAAEVQRDIPAIKEPQFVILNGFDAVEFQSPVTNKKAALQLVWFSQHIDAGRGLEAIIPAVNQLYPAVELQLVGFLHESFARRFLQDKRGITIHAPLPQQDLHQLLAHCDVGLAADVPVNKNRELALTNKMLAYAQSGLLIVATTTASHMQFLEMGELDYRIVDGSSVSYRQIFEMLIEAKENIRQQAKSRYEKGRVFDALHLYRPLFDLLNNN